MDEFKQCMTHYTGIAGIKCNCCNPYRNKDKRKLHKLARAKLKRDNLRRLGEAYAEAVAKGELKPKRK